MSGRVAEQWSSFITGLSFDNLPAGLVHRMKQSLLDSLGAAVLGSQGHAGQILLSYLAAQGSTAESTVITSGTQLTAAHAAMVNSAFIHSTELWEFFDRAAMPPGIFVPAVALALAERHNATGRDFLAAMVAGYEIAIRAGLAIRVDSHSPTMAAKDNGRPAGRDGPMGFYLAGATFGVYGATAAAAKLLRLDAEQTAHALTFCSSALPVIGLERSAAPEAAMPKDTYMAFTAGIGVMAAELAARGLTGRRDLTPHIAALVADYEPAMLTRGLGSEYFVTSGGLHPKLTAGSYYTQAAAAAALELRTRHVIDLRDVDSIAVWVNERAARKEFDRSPPNIVAARSSLPFIISAILMADDEFLDGDPHLTQLYTQDRLRDMPRHELAQKVSVFGSAQFERRLEHDWPSDCPARVTVTMSSGQRLSAESSTRSASSRTDEQVTRKFQAVAGPVVGPDKAELAAHEALRIDAQPSVHELMKALSTAQPLEE